MSSQSEYKKQYVLRSGKVIYNQHYRPLPSKPTSDEELIHKPVAIKKGNMIVDDNELQDDYPIISTKDQLSDFPPQWEAYDDSDDYEEKRNRYTYNSNKQRSAYYNTQSQRHKSIKSRRLAGRKMVVSSGSDNEYVIIKETVEYPYGQEAAVDHSYKSSPYVSFQSEHDSADIQYRSEKPFSSPENDYKLRYSVQCDNISTKRIRSSSPMSRMERKYQITSSPSLIKNDSSIELRPLGLDSEKDYKKELNNKKQASDTNLDFLFTQNNLDLKSRLPMSNSSVFTSKVHENCNSDDQIHYNERDLLKKQKTLGISDDEQHIMYKYKENGDSGPEMQHFYKRPRRSNRLNKKRLEISNTQNSLNAIHGYGHETGYDSDRENNTLGLNNEKVNFKRKRVKRIVLRRSKRPNRDNPNKSFPYRSESTSAQSASSDGEYKEENHFDYQLSNETFDDVAGLECHIEKLKEMIIWPLLYPEAFTNYNIRSPKGVLFYGPPGTGKTMMAKALVNSCEKYLNKDNESKKKISFFIKNGAEILSKWIGEAEKNLRNLFREARNASPSIIFFDEIDGMAPARTVKQDQSHISLVSTLLTLMDGLGDRGQVIVIGATNRINALDPALRRPGRFDKEFYFPLPKENARLALLKLQLDKWKTSDKMNITEDFLRDLAAKTKGYCGADIKALCTEAVLSAMRRNFAEENSMMNKYETNSFSVEKLDFDHAFINMMSSYHRQNPVISKSYEIRNVFILLVYEKHLLRLKGYFFKIHHTKWTESSISLCSRRLMITNDPYHTYLLNHFFHITLPSLINDIFLVDLNFINLYNDVLVSTTCTPEMQLIKLLNDCVHNKPSLCYIYNIEKWKRSLKNTNCWMILCEFLDTLTTDDEIYFIASSGLSFNDLPKQVQRLFNSYNHGHLISIIEIFSPDKDTRRHLFQLLHTSLQEMLKENIDSFYFDELTSLTNKLSNTELLSLCQELLSAKSMTMVEFKVNNVDFRLYSSLEMVFQY